MSLIYELYRCVGNSITYRQRKPKRIVDKLQELFKKMPKCPVLKKQKGKMNFPFEVSVIL